LDIGGVESSIVNVRKPLGALPSLFDTLIRAVGRICFKALEHSNPTVINIIFQPRILPWK